MLLKTMFDAASEEFMKVARHDAMRKLDYLGYLLVSPGLLRHVALRGFVYLRPGFHPWARNPKDLSLLEATKPDIGVS